MEARGEAQEAKATCRFSLFESTCLSCIPHLDLRVPI